MDAFEKAREKAREKANEPLARFGPLFATMRVVHDHSDLEALRKGGIGFIINLRPEQAKIHWVSCESIEVMKASKYPKIFSLTAREAVAWLERDSSAVWDHCGLCGGGNHANSSESSHT